MHRFLHGLAGLVLAVLAPELPAADLIRIQPVTDKILVLYFSEGHIDYFGIGQERARGNRVYYSRLDTDAAAVFSNYTITSPDDIRYQTGRGPVALGRKSKGESFNDLYAAPMPKVLMAHWIYLELPFNMIQGSTYTVKLHGLASNVNTYTFLFDAFSLRSPAIHLNQIGMVPEAPKYAYLSQWMGSFNTPDHPAGALNLDRYYYAPFHLVRTSDNAIVFSGSVNRHRLKTAADFSSMTFSDKNYTRADVWQCDFSAFTTPGEYRLVVEKMGSSYPFEIGDDVYRQAYHYTSRALFTQRQGVNKEIEPGLIYPRDHRTEDGIVMKYYPDLKTEGNFDPNKGKGNVTGVWGWYHDAGDWDTYPDHYVVPMTLLALFDLKPENFGDGDVGARYQTDAGTPWIDEGKNGLPDVLDEAMWLIKYYKRTREALIAQGYSTGGIPGYAGVDAGAESGTASWQDKRVMALKGADSVLMAYRYAACAAYLGIDLDRFAGGLHPASASWIGEAKTAYAWAHAQNQDADDDINRSRMMAAAALYRSTGIPTYQEDFRGCKARDNGWKSFLWYMINPWHHAALIFGRIPDGHPGLDRALRQECIDDLVAMADKETVQTAGDRGFRYGASRSIMHMLGSLSTPRLFLAAVAFEFTGEKKFLDACYTTCDYCLGGNQLDLVRISGLGENPERQPFHCDSWYLTDYNSMVYDNPILPGYVIYDMHYTGDWMSGESWTWIGDEDYSRSTAYPAIADFPDGEARFPNRWSIAGSEFTIQQTQCQAIFAYGYLCGPHAGIYTPNTRPEVALNLAGDSTVRLDSTLLLSVKASEDVRRVEYYYDYHFIGESVDKAHDFAFAWNLADYKILRGRRLITARAFDDLGMESRPTEAGQRSIFCDEASAVKKAESGSLRFELRSCYPNPVNPVTRIPFSLAVPGPARLSLCNLLGEQVAILADGLMAAGAHEVAFDASRLPSGVYFYTLQQEARQQVRKLLVLR
ncbi:MAG TPA: glycoside hydrolase family 9 protein [bacterium]|nr:glycoside hydrolase family 9 protein [bacterium]HQJ63759.1 glycoside hydrolase family 9 protein [bacterium]